LWVIAIVLLQEFLSLRTKPTNFIGYHALARLAVCLDRIITHCEMRSNRFGWRDSAHVDALGVEGPKQRRFDLSGVISLCAIVVEAGNIGLKVRKGVEARTDVRLYEANQRLEVLPRPVVASQ